MLAEVGPDVLSLREVARRVGVGHRAAYRHFADKEALFAAVAEEGYRDLARAYTRFAAEHPGHYVHFVLPRKLKSPRFRRIEPVDRVFVHHLRIARLDEVDCELQAWLRHAYEEYGVRGSSGSPPLYSEGAERAEDCERRASSVIAPYSRTSDLV
jgi:AcrR family transcriptional regulator